MQLLKVLQLKHKVIHGRVLQHKAAVIQGLAVLPPVQITHSHVLLQKVHQQAVLHRDMHNLAQHRVTISLTDQVQHITVVQAPGVRHEAIVRHPQVPLHNIGVRQAAVEAPARLLTQEEAVLEVLQVVRFQAEVDPTQVEAVEAVEVVVAEVAVHQEVEVHHQDAGKFYQIKLHQLKKYCHEKIFFYDSYCLNNASFNKRSKFS